MATDFSLNTENLAAGFTKHEGSVAIEGFRITLNNRPHLTLAGPVDVTYDPSEKVFTFTADVVPSDLHPHTQFVQEFHVDFS